MDFLDPLLDANHDNCMVSNPDYLGSQMTTLPDNTHSALLTTLILVLSVLACTTQVPSTPTTLPTTVPDNTRIPKPVLSGKPTTPTKAVVSVVTASQSLNVRAARGLQARVIGNLYHGDTVTLTSKCDQGWAEIVWKDGTAWVNAKFLSSNKCSEMEEK